MENVFEQIILNFVCKINSWYRDPKSNKASKGAINSRHLKGDAVDFWFPEMLDLYKRLYDSWSGGLAIKTNAFVHIDARHFYGESRARWTY